VALTLAHQHLEQPSQELRASLMTNPAIRLVGGLSSRDARALAPEMRTSPEHLMSVAKRERETELACFVRNHTPSAVTLKLRLGNAEREPRMSETAYAAMIDRIRAKVAVPIAETRSRIDAAHEAKVAREEPEELADSY
jgi:hypothetical protein